MERATQIIEKPWDATIVVTNRLPISVTENKAGVLCTQNSDGGMVTGMNPVLQRNGRGVWLGSPGIEEKEGLEEVVRTAANDHPFDLRHVGMTAEELQGHYNDYSNQTLWPALHGLTDKINYVPGSFKHYTDVNCKFAEMIVQESTHQDFIWVHDYHLMLVGREMRKLGSNQTVGFYSHIKFPTPDKFSAIPEHQELLEALLSYDLVGHQTPGDMKNFILNLQTFIPEAIIEDTPDGTTITYKGDKTLTGAFPISIDPNEFERVAQEEKTTSMAQSIADKLDGKHLFLGVARSDDTKALPEGLKAYALFLENHPNLAKDVHYKQLIVPSRENIQAAEQLKEDIWYWENEFNRRYAVSPLETIHGKWNRHELIANYSITDTGLVIPHADGQNLIPWELGAVNRRNANLILSKGAGAYDRLGIYSLGIDNPRNAEDVSEAMYKAVVMSPEERAARFEGWRNTVYGNTVFQWADSYETEIAKIWGRRQLAAINNNQIQQTQTTEIPAPTFRMLEPRGFSFQ